MKKIIFEFFISIIFAILIISIGLMALPHIMGRMSYNYKKISEVSQKELKNILEIDNANSFELIYIKHVRAGFGSDDKYYEIKFEISVEDYEKNGLSYGEESFYDIYMDCRHKEKKDNTTYTCIRRISISKNKDLYESINEL